MAGNNGSGGRIFLPGGALAGEEPDGQTVEQWVNRHPDKAVGRAELDAFTDILVKTKVRDLMLYVLNKKDEQHQAEHERMIQGVQEIVVAMFAEQRRRKWYRRLGRWIATFGHKPPEAPRFQASLEELRTLEGEMAKLQVTRPDKPQAVVTGIGEPPAEPDQPSPGPRLEP